MTRVAGALKTVLIVSAGIGLIVGNSRSVAAADPSVGDVFAAVASGKVIHFSPAGKPASSLASSGASGMCFDPAGHLYITNFDQGVMTKVDSSGHVLQRSWGNTRGAESCLVTRNGEVLVGEAVGDRKLLKLRSDGSLISAYQPAIEDKGIDWIDLAANQCTVFYTSEGNSVKRFDICGNGQLPDFRKGLAGKCYGLRLLASGGLLVACEHQVYRLNSDGSTARTYTTGSLGERATLFALNLDPDGQSFWTSSYDGGNLYKVDLATGARLASFSTGEPVYGLTVFGEPIAGGASLRSSFATSVPDLPHALGLLVRDPVHAAGNLILALLSLVMIAFTKEVFNQTVKENYEEIRRWFRFWQPVQERLIRGWDGRPPWQNFVAFSLIGGVLYGFLEPRFGTDLGITAAVLLGMALALAATVLVHTVAVAGSVWTRQQVFGRLRFFPILLPVAIGCVAISRLVHFQPGYIYGVFAGIAFRRELSSAVEGTATAIAAVATLLVSFVAWIAWIPVESQAGPGAPFSVFVLENFLVLVFVLGLEALLFGLLPLRFLEGEKLFNWNSRWWFAIWLTSAFLALQVLVNPASRGRFVVSDSVGPVTWVVLFLAFGALTGGLWLWFRWRPASTRSEPAITVLPEPVAVSPTTAEPKND